MRRDRNFAIPLELEELSMRARTKTTAVIGVLLALALAFATTGPEGWHDHGYSRGRHVLEPGRHRIRIRSLRSPFGGSTGWLEVLGAGMVSAEPLIAVVP